MHTLTDLRETPEYRLLRYLLSVTHAPQQFPQSRLNKHGSTPIPQFLILFTADSGTHAVRTTCCSGSRDPKAEAEEIKQRLTKFMRNDPHLELSDEKTLITRTSAAAFLGYENTTQTGTGGRKSLNGPSRCACPPR
jgi:hypothetical protein